MHNNVQRFPLRFIEEFKSSATEPFSRFLSVNGKKEPYNRTQIENCLNRWNDTLCDSLHRHYHQHHHDYYHGCYYCVLCCIADTSQMP